MRPDQNDRSIAVPATFDARLASLNCEVATANEAHETMTYQQTPGDGTYNPVLSGTILWATIMEEMKKGDRLEHWLNWFFDLELTGAKQDEKYRSSLSVLLDSRKKTTTSNCDIVEIASSHYGLLTDAAMFNFAAVTIEGLNQYVKAESLDVLFWRKLLAFSHKDFSQSVLSTIIEQWIQDQELDTFLEFHTGLSDNNRYSLSHALLEHKCHQLIESTKSSQFVFLFNHVHPTFHLDIMRLLASSCSQPNFSTTFRSLLQHIRIPQEYYERIAVSAEFATPAEPNLVFLQFPAESQTLHSDLAQLFGDILIDNAIDMMTSQHFITQVSSHAQQLTDVYTAILYHSNFRSCLENITFPHVRQLLDAISDIEMYHSNISLILRALSPNLIRAYKTVFTELEDAGSRLSFIEQNTGDDDSNPWLKIKAKCQVMSQYADEVESTRFISHVETFAVSLVGDEEHIKSRLRKFGITFTHQKDRLQPLVVQPVFVTLKIKSNIEDEKARLEGFMDGVRAEITVQRDLLEYPDSKESALEIKALPVSELILSAAKLEKSDPKQALRFSKKALQRSISEECPIETIQQLFDQVLHSTAVISHIDDFFELLVWAKHEINLRRLDFSTGESIQLKIDGFVSSCAMELELQKRRIQLQGSRIVICEKLKTELMHQMRCCKEAYGDEAPPEQSRQLFTVLVDLVNTQLQLNSKEVISIRDLLLMACEYGADFFSESSDLSNFYHSIFVPVFESVNEEDPISMIAQINLLKNESFVYLLDVGNCNSVEKKIARLEIGLALERQYNDLCRVHGVAYYLSSQFVTELQQEMNLSTSSSESQLGMGGGLSSDVTVTYQQFLCQTNVLTGLLELQLSGCQSLDRDVFIALLAIASSLSDRFQNSDRKKYYSNLVTHLNSLRVDILSNPSSDSSVVLLLSNSALVMLFLQYFDGQPRSRIVWDNVIATTSYFRYGYNREKLHPDRLKRDIQLFFEKFKLSLLAILIHNQDFADLIICSLCDFLSIYHPASYVNQIQTKLTGYREMVQQRWTPHRFFNSLSVTDMLPSVNRVHVVKSLEKLIDFINENPINPYDDMLFISYVISELKDKVFSGELSSTLQQILSRLTLTCYEVSTNRRRLEVRMDNLVSLFNMPEDLHFLKLLGYEPNEVTTAICHPVDARPAQVTHDDGAAEEGSSILAEAYYVQPQQNSQASLKSSSLTSKKVSKQELQSSSAGEPPSSSNRCIIC